MGQNDVHQAGGLPHPGQMGSAWGEGCTHFFFSRYCRTSLSSAASLLASEVILRMLFRADLGHLPNIRDSNFIITLPTTYTKNKLPNRRLPVQPGCLLPHHKTGKESKGDAALTWIQACCTCRSQTLSLSYRQGQLAIGPYHSQQDSSKLEKLPFFHQKAGLFDQEPKHTHPSPRTMSVVAGCSFGPLAQAQRQSTSRPQPCCMTARCSLSGAAPSSRYLSGTPLQSSRRLTACTSRRQQRVGTILPLLDFLICCGASGKAIISGAARIGSVA